MAQAIARLREQPGFPSGNIAASEMAQNRAQKSERKSYTVHSVMRASQILKSFHSTCEVLELRTIASRVGFTKPTAFRLLETLVEADMVERVGRRGYRGRLVIPNRRPFRIGYGAQSSVIPFTSTVTDSLLTAASAANVDLLVLNNNFSAKAALINAERFVDEKVDLVIDSQVDFKVAAQVAAKFSDANIPFIAVDVPHPGSIYFGADNYKAGRMAGRCLGKWSARLWRAEVEQVMLLGADIAGPTLNTRLTGMLDGIYEGLTGNRAVCVTRIDTRGQFERTLDAVRKHLRSAKARRVLVGAVNDITALAALQAFRDMGREADCAVAGQDACIEARQEMRRTETRFICSVAYFPESYGERIIKLALDILNHKPVPPAQFMNHELVTPLNVNRVYPHDDWMTASMSLQGPIPSCLHLDFRSAIAK